MTGSDSQRQHDDHADQSPLLTAQLTLGFWLGLVVVVTLALALRLLSYHEIRQSPLLTDTPFLADAVYYDYRAKQIAGGDWLGQEVFFMAPLYEFTVAVPYALTGQSIDKPDFRLARKQYRIDPAIYLQCFYGALTCGLLYALAYGWFSSIAGWAAGLMSAGYGPFIFFDGLLMAASLVLFTGVLSIAVLSWSDRRGGWWRWLMSGFAVGIASLAHGSMLAVAPAVVLVMLLFPSKGNRRQALVNASVFGLGAAMMIAPVTVRNYLVGDDFVLLTSNGGMNFFIGNNPHATGTHTVYQYPFPMTKLSDYYQRPKRTPDSPAPSFVSRQVAARAWGWLAENPTAALGLWLTKFRLWFNGVELGIRDHYHFFRQFSAVLRGPVLSFAVVGPLGLTGAVFLIRRMRELRFVYLVLMVQTAVFVLMFVLGRYRFCATACLMLLGAGQIAWWIERARAREFGLLAASVAVLAAFAVLVNYPVNGFDENHGAAKLYANLGDRLLTRGIQDKNAQLIDDAIAAFNQAEKLEWGQSGLSVSRSKMLLRAADARLAKGDIDGARQYGTKALEQIAEELKAPPADFAPVTTPYNTLRRRAASVQQWLNRLSNAGQSIEDSQP